MSCFITEGYSLDCRNASLGGLKAVWILGDSGNTTIADFIEDEREFSSENSDVNLEMLKDNLSFTLRSLTAREVNVLKMRFGMDDGIKRTLEEVGDTYCVTRERIRQIEAKAIRKLLNMIADNNLKAA